METIAERIKHALKLRDMRPADLAKATGINKSSLSEYLSGKVEPKQRNLFKIAKALNVNVAWLMGYVDDPAVNNSPESYEELKNAVELQQLYSHPIMKFGRDLGVINPRAFSPAQSQMYDLVKDATEEELAELINYAKYVLAKRGK